MAGFCTKCGRPLPESGVCPCTMQENPAPQGYVPQQPQQGYVAPQYSTAPSKVGMAVGGSLKNIPNLLVGYFRDPVGTTRLAAEKKDLAGGLMMMAISLIVTLLGTLFFGLVQLYYWSFGDFVLPWLGVTFLGPIVGYGLTIGMFYILTAIAKMRVDFRAVVAATGVSSVLVVMLLAASMLLSMISPIVFEIFVILACGAWIVGFFTTVFQVFGIKMNIINTVVVVLGIAVATYAVVELITWLAFNTNNCTLFSLLT